MNRNIFKSLADWKQSKTRQPLLIRGARQVGKTFAVELFGRENFRNLVTINFEERPEFKRCFDSYNPEEIIRKISILTGAVITSGETLLFLDEIQECPRAITALRYFKEKLPLLHIIGAGSLLEFALRSENFRMPVGRVQTLFMLPLSFYEYLEATGQGALLTFLGEVSANQAASKHSSANHSIDEVIAEKLEKELRSYMILGGMPGAVHAHINGAPIQEIKHLQNSLLLTFQKDFAKYAATVKHKYLQEVFLSAPRMVGKRYKYAQVNPYVQSRELKEALILLSHAQCLYKVCHTAANGLPLEAEMNERRFKIVFLDIGLMQNTLGLDAKVMFERDLMPINAGAVVEQFVGQELLACQDPYLDKKLFFWNREQAGSTSEVDYIISIGSHPIPVEVKAGKRGTLKSMRVFLDKHPDCPLGIRYSTHELSYYEKILSIPLYMINETVSLCRSFIGNI